MQSNIGGIPMLLIDYQRQNDYFFFNRDFRHENKILDKKGGTIGKLVFWAFQICPQAWSNSKAKSRKLTSKQTQAEKFAF